MRSIWRLEDDFGLASQPLEYGGFRAIDKTVKLLQFFQILWRNDK